MEMYVDAFYFYCRKVTFFIADVVEQSVHVGQDVINLRDMMKCNKGQDFVSVHVWSEHWKTPDSQLVRVRKRFHDGFPDAL